MMQPRNSATAAESAATPAGRGRYLAGFLSSKDNNYQLIRFIAASAVLYHHAYILTAGSEAPDPITRLTGRSVGAAAVDIFFVVSGLLVARSLFSRGSVRAYARARGLRIYPGLIVAVLFCAFLIGPICTTGPLGAYFKSGQVYNFIVRDGISLRSTVQDLPKVFDANPYPNAVNGSLWTLPWEIRMYIVLALLYIAARKHARWTIPAFAAAATVLHFLDQYRVVPALERISEGLRLASFFFMGGATYYLFSERIRLNGYVAIVIAVAILALSQRSLQYPVYFFGLPYVIFSSVYLPGGWIRNYNKLGDYSYGMYIYAFPIQQSLIHFFSLRTPGPLFFISFALTLLMATLSWHFIESRFLRLK